MTTIRLRRGSAAQWITANPVLAQGEPGIDTTNGGLRIGDGVSSWLDLPEFRDVSALTDLLASRDLVSVDAVSGGTYMIDPRAATYFSVELSGDATLAAEGFDEGISVTVEVVQDAAGGHVLSLPASWVGSAAVALGTDATTLERLVVWQAAGRMNVQQAAGGPFPLPPP